MAEIIDGGNLMFRSLVYGKTHPGTQQFIASQFDRMSPTLTDAGRRFSESAREFYEYLNSSTTASMLRAVGRQIRSIWEKDEIRPLLDIGHLQSAQYTMQRWIMAEPTVRSLFHQQRVDGYSEEYIDHEPGRIGEDQYDWRRVMDGIVVMDETPNEQGEYGWSATSSYDDLLPDDTDLELDEQVDILNTWHALRGLLGRGREDPTSRFNTDQG